MEQEATLLESQAKKDEIQKVNAIRLKEKMIDPSNVKILFKVRKNRSLDLIRKLAGKERSTSLGKKISVPQDYLDGIKTKARLYNSEKDAQKKVSIAASLAKAKDD
jgi:hypothetical protein